MDELVRNPPAQVVFDYDRTIATVPVDWLVQRPAFRTYLAELGADISALPSGRVDLMEYHAVHTLGMDWDEVYAFRQRVEEEVDGKHLLNQAVFPTLQKLIKQGQPLSILSNNFRKTVMAGLEQFGIQDAFQVVVGVDDTRDPKPGIRGLEVLKKSIQLDPKDAVLVGDSPSTDGQFCNATGIAFLQVDTLSERVD